MYPPNNGTGGDDEREEDRDLEKSLGHRLEPLAAQEREDRVDREPDGDDQREQLAGDHARSRRSIETSSAANTITPVATITRAQRKSMPDTVDPRA